jgi:hypothetical protein
VGKGIYILVIAGVSMLLGSLAVFLAKDKPVDA